MKKTLLIAAALMLAGCTASGDKPVPLEKSFICTAELNGDAGYTAELERSENSGWRVKLTAPESAAGIELCYLADGKCTLELQGHTAVYDRESLPEYAPFDLITSAADMCIEGKGVTVGQSGSRSVMNGELRGMSFTAESEKGSLTSLTVGGSIVCNMKPLPQLDSE